MVFPRFNFLINNEIMWNQWKYTNISLLLYYTPCHTMSLWYLSHTLVTQNTHRKLWILSEPLNHTNQRLLSHMNTDTILQYKYRLYQAKHTSKTQKSRLCWYKPLHCDKILKKVRSVICREISSTILIVKKYESFGATLFAEFCQCVVLWPFMTFIWCLFCYLFSVVGLTNGWEV